MASYPLERQLEDFICANPNALTCGMTHLTLLGRQVRVQHGVIDLLALAHSVQVIELKAAPLKEKDVGQLLRYIADVDAIMVAMATHFSAERILGIRAAGEDEEFSYRMVRSHRAGGILVGTSVSPNVLAACEGANITVVLWKWERGTFHFWPPRCQGHLPDPPYPDWATRASRMLAQLHRREIDEDHERAFPSTAAAGADIGDNADAMV